ncbi:GDSL esterase/lipase At5g45910-like isoform X2 [Oryza glaberrima]|uniref:GDSL esterase/lipase At5g45910-like isoform X2 n=1 Tax=Oryza glaberrima TaxID=4538 RepID=UPI00224BFFDD|nr:GDSL esterase/lipase At5g45910-like isoform X2 [Oryza glaberrima]
MSPVTPAAAPPPSPSGATTPSSASATPWPTPATTPSSSTAERLGLPLVPPFLAYNGSFRHGANFAVGAATALDSSFFHGAGDPPGASPFPLNTSLSVQLSWFDSLKPSLCSTTQECKDFFGRSLFFVGEFGINDYHSSFGRRSMQEIRSFVPDIIRTISMAIEKLIGDGATTVVVPGMIPSGCSPPVLVTFADAGAAEYDASTGCLREPNEVATLHNSLLLDAVEELREKHPDVAIVHTDLFRHVSEMVQNPDKFGFQKDVLSVCCGGPGKYHYNTRIICGDEGATTCVDPSKSLYWDGVHLTEAAYHYIADDWLHAITLSARATS